jgi:predicted GNAT superfamily acetyltransferase
MALNVRDIVPADFGRVLAINEDEVQALSPLDEASLARLHAEAAYHRGLDADGEIVGFLIALREGAGYASVNYRWFASRQSKFLYVDRVVVARSHQRAGAGRALYEDLFRFARESAVGLVTCEFDIAPPNEASRRFHEHYGFRTVGTQALGSGKLVALQALELELPPTNDNPSDPSHPQTS